MMTTNLFVTANVKQSRTGGSFRILLPFFRTSWGVRVLNSAIFNSFHNWVELGTILEGLRNFGGGGWFEPPNPPPSVRRCSPPLLRWTQHHIKLRSTTNTYLYSTPSDRQILFSKTVFMNRSIEGGEGHTLSSRWIGGLMLGRFFSWWHRHAFNQGMMISMTIRTIKHNSGNFYDTSRWNKTANSLSSVWFNLTHSIVRIF